MLYEWTTQTGSDRGNCGDCKETDRALAINFSNYEIISHNAKYCCDAPKKDVDRASICHQLHGMRGEYPRFTPIGHGPLRYNSSHVDRSAFPTFGAAVR
jgi:hypothetical protein